MKKVFLALSLTLFVGTVVVANTTNVNGTQTGIEKDDDKKKKKKKKSKKEGCCSSKTEATKSSCGSKTETTKSSCCSKKKN